jgi:hypothetical protein
MIIANAVMMTGRKRVVPASSAAVIVAVMQQPFFGKGDNEDAVRRGHAHAHDGSHQSGNAESRMRDEKEQDNSGKGRGQRVMMMNGSSHDWKFTTISKYTRMIAKPRPPIRPI